MSVLRRANALVLVFTSLAALLVAAPAAVAQDAEDPRVLPREPLPEPVEPLPPGANAVAVGAGAGESGETDGAGEPAPDNPESARPGLAKVVARQRSPTSAPLGSTWLTGRAPRRSTSCR